MDSLLAEARAACQLDHANIARVYQAGISSERRLFVVMEFVSGENLEEVLKRGPLPVVRACEVVGKVLDALGEAHRLGIIHRDIKPANIMLTPDGGVKVLDFGLAKLSKKLVLPGAEGVIETVSHAGARDDAPGGTPHYMAPEQLRQNPADARSDLFACGVVLYQCIAGKRPFEGTLATLFAAILHQNPAPLRSLGVGVEARIEFIVGRALEKDPEQRFQSASEMAQAIRDGSGTSARFAGDSRARIQRRLVIAAGVAVLIAITMGVFLRPEPTLPNRPALRWYRQGVEAIRDGTYFSATLALSRLTEADPAFALGHARLAEVWAELDSPEKAQQELLLARRTASGWWRKSFEEKHVIAAIEAIVLRDFHSAIEHYQQLLSTSAVEDGPGIWLDLGRVQEKLNDLNAATESYTKAATLDPSHAAAWMLRAVVRGRRQDFAGMESDFRSARAIYEASQNFEGLAELAYQQGRVATNRKDLASARQALGRALETAARGNDEFHFVRAMTQLSIVSYMEGKSAEAEELSTKAIARARAARMPVLTVQALVDLGNAQLAKLDLPSAETTLREAVEAAKRDRLPRAEARARLSLGSTLVQAQRDDEAIPEINAAAAYYSKGPSPFETNIGRVLLGRIYRRRGEFPEVHRILQEILGEARATGDKGKISDALGEIANTFATEERYAEALAQFEQRRDLTKDGKALADVGFSLTGKASMLLRLGATDRAALAIEEAQAKAGWLQGISGRIGLLKLDVLHRRAQWAACAAGFQEFLREGRLTSESEMYATARRMECLANGGKMAEARGMLAAAELLAAKQNGSFGAAWLRVTMALVETEPYKFAVPLGESIQYFQKRNQWESLWMAETIAVIAFARSDDQTRRILHGKSRENAWKSLRSRMPDEFHDIYDSQPLVSFYRKKD